MKKLTTLLTVMCLCLSAQAARIAIPVSVTAIGTATNTALVEGVNTSVTNWSLLQGFTVAVPAGAQGLFTLYSISGTTAITLDKFTVRNSSTNSTAYSAYIVPRGNLTSAFNPAVDRYPLIGTNFYFTLAQSGTTTNAYTSTNTWSVGVLIEQ